MGKRWLREKKRDYYYRKAKMENYRSRAAYKLLQLSSKFRFLRRGFRVIELGCAPGGWTQVASRIVGEEGRVVGVDLQRVEWVAENVEVIQGDFTSQEVRLRLRELMPECEVVLSDASPGISGVWSVDHARSIALCEAALEIAEEHLVDGGTLVTKVFQGDMLQEFLGKLRSRFRHVRIAKPGASRKRSAEVYLVALGYRKMAE